MSGDDDLLPDDFAGPAGRPPVVDDDAITLPGGETWVTAAGAVARMPGVGLTERIVYEWHRKLALVRAVYAIGRMWYPLSECRRAERTTRRAGKRPQLDQG